MFKLESISTSPEIWWFSCKKMTVKVAVRGGVVVDTAPITRKFVGQPVKNLELWMQRLGGFEKSRLN